ncbi:hypothetical protein C5E46_30650 [Nocardia nova]|jgi:hypothetical protein|nr:hypothetical protein C5E46_30650 [Nocardia nova]
MACVVVYDANVLYGNTLRAMMIRSCSTRSVSTTGDCGLASSRLRILGATIRKLQKTYSTHAKPERLMLKE